MREDFPRGMGSEGKNKHGDGRGEALGIPATAEKVVQSLKEIVNCTEQEIYAILGECDMDPNRAVERLLALDTFHEVKSKRERRKEMKEALDSRSRVNTVGLNLGGKTGSECNVLQSGSTRITYNELGKARDQGEVGSVCPSVTSSMNHVVGKNTNSDSFSTDNGRQSIGTSDSISASTEVCPGFEPTRLGLSKGNLSMADIVRMGRPSQDCVSHYPPKAPGASAKSESSLSLYSQNHSGQQVFHDDWPVIEHSMADNSHPLNVSASSDANESSDQSNLHGTTVSFLRSCESDAAQVSHWDLASYSDSSNKIEHCSMSTRHIVNNAGQASHSNYTLRSIGSSITHSSAKHLEDMLTSEAIVDMSSAASDFQQLSLRDSKLEVPSSEVNCAVVFPNHLQVLAAECSHLSFGTFNSGRNSVSSVMHASNLSTSDLEQKDAAADGSLAQNMNASNSVYCGDKRLEFDNLRETASDANYGFLSSVSSVMPTYNLSRIDLEEKAAVAAADDSLAQNLNASNSIYCGDKQLRFDDLRETERDTNYSFLSSQQELVKHVIPERADSNYLPDGMVAFGMTPSEFARYSNPLSSIGNPAITKPEVKKPSAFALPHRSALLQDLTVQPSQHLEQLADARGYGSRQNHPYMSAINSQEAFLGSTAYNQSRADMTYNLLQYRNISRRLPPARDAFVSPNLGSSYNPGAFLPNPSLGHMMPSSNFDEILPSQYSGGRNLSSNLQHGSSSTWDYGTSSRSSSRPESTHQFFSRQPSQASSQYITTAYPDHYFSEFQRQDGFQDLSSKQSHQFWQRNH